MANEEVIEKSLQIFFPHFCGEKKRIQDNKKRFVHYTTAEAAMNILRTKKIWMNNAQSMNDYSEVQHGIRCLQAAYKSSDGENFKAVLNNIFPNFSTELEKQFDGWVPHFQSDTYLLCVSEHLDVEDTIGRLSMWRAYGGTCSVAIVLNTEVFFGSADLPITTSPVAYLDDEKFITKFRKVVENIKAETSFIKTLPKDTLLAVVFQMFRFAALCTKHEGFGEELEWRVMYTPGLGESKYVEKGIQVLKGVPQPIYKIPLQDIPEIKFKGAALPSLIDRIIIGPNRYPGPTWRAFVELLSEAGIEDAAKKVFYSQIPLRT